MFAEVKKVFVLIGILLTACGNQAPIVSSTEQIATVTPFSFPPTWTPSLTLHLNTPTLSPTYTNTPKPTPTQKTTLPSDWLLIPRLTHPEPIDLSTARLFKGLKIPPLPNEIIIEFATGPPYGEVPPETIFYKMYLIRKGNTRMLWLGIPFKETVACCGLDTPHRIYDSIPFPPIKTDSVLIPFTCIQKHGWDIFLIVVAELPENGAEATNVLYAWRIEPATTTLQPVSTQGLECEVY